MLDLLKAAVGVQRVLVESFASINRVVLLQTDEGFGIDVALGALPF